MLKMFESYITSDMVQRFLPPGFFEAIREALDRWTVYLSAIVDMLHGIKAHQHNDKLEILHHLAIVAERLDAIEARLALSEKAGAIHDRPVE